MNEAYIETTKRGFDLSVTITCAYETDLSAALKECVKDAFEMMMEEWGLYVTVITSPEAHEHAGSVTAGVTFKLNGSRVTERLRECIGRAAKSKGIRVVKYRPPLSLRAQ